MSSENPWKTLSSRVAYRNEWLQIREDRVLRPDGEPGIYGVVEIRPSIGVLCFNQAGEMALVGQWRYTLNRYAWEIVRGGSSPDDTDMLATAQRELQEETGYTAATWEFLGPVDVCNGVTTDVQHLFIARQLTFTGSHPDPVEDLTLAWHPFETVLKMVLNREITEVCSVAGILWHNCLWARDTGLH